MSEILLPSEAIALLLTRLSACKDVRQDEVIEIDAVSAQAVFSGLDEIRKQVRLLEYEVFTHRLGEASQKGRHMIDELASNQFEELALDPEGKVVRPDFGRGGHS